MLKLLSGTAAALCLIIGLAVTTPSNAASGKAPGVHQDQQTADISAQRRRYAHRHYRGYRHVRPYRHYRPYYGYGYRPYYRPYYAAPFPFFPFFW
jgi:hypothetical protein